jgi:hypothetical protein
MSRKRTVMTIVGGTTIVGMLLVAAFSLGVYAGEHGLNWRGVSLAGPPSRAGDGPHPPAQGTPPGGGPLPAGPPDLMGRVRALENGYMHLATRDGPRTVTVDEQTQVHTETEKNVGVDAIQPGTTVAVFGHPEKDGRTLVADIVVILR